MTTSRSSTTLNRGRMRRLFESLAKSSWDWLGHARSLGMGLSEDTISDLTALEIARFFPTKIEVTRVSKQNEHWVGFDWAWIFHRRKMRPKVYVVQAKKLQIDQSQAYVYPKLRHGNSSHYQINALKDFADWIGATPLYCFYNNVDSQTAISHWHCRQQAQPDPPQIGCTLVPFDRVKEIHDGPGPRGFRHLHKTADALPWRCLFHKRCTTFSLDAPDAELTRAQLNRLHDFAEVFSTNDPIIEANQIIDALDLNRLVNEYIAQNVLPLPIKVVSAYPED